MTGSERPGTIGIVGLGLMGGSLARRLRNLPGPPRILASSLEVDDLGRAIEEGIIDEGTRDPGEVADAARILIYATPLDVTLELLEAHHERWGSETVVTDVVSLKAPLARRVRELGVAHAWIGGHPMAGSEASGFAASTPDLFQDARVYLVPGEAKGEAEGEADGEVRGQGGDESTHRETANREAARQVEELWEAVGARPLWIGAEEHDRRMIWASHLPQLTASALASALDKEDIAPEDLGPGGRDMTRLAGSSPELWKSLFAAAGQDESGAIEALRGELRALDAILGGADAGRIAAYMERARAWREGARAGREGKT